MHDELEVINTADLTEIFGLESFLLKSVGITIGSSTTHLMFSRLTVRRSDSRASHFAIVEREVIHRSPIIFTPYIEGVRVDTEKLRHFFKDVYNSAEITPEAVDTGAVIITGYAARKENAGGLVNLFSRWAGKFVCETAGPNLESMMAAYGSGAVRRSKETGKTVMNVDIGGGTSKIAIIRAGTVVETAALFVGSRAIVTDSSGRLVRMEAAGSLAAKEIDIELKPGASPAAAEQEALADILTQSLFELIDRKSPSPFTQRLMETAPIRYKDKIDLIMFSGGVAEYIYGYEQSDFGDLGPYLGEKIRRHISDSEYRMMLRIPEERIRATVMGAAQYSLQVSGNTIFISSNVTLPLRNLQVVSVRLDRADPTADSIATSIREALARYDFDSRAPTGTVALALDIASSLEIGPAFLRNLTAGILSTANDYFETGAPVILILDIDIANLVGNILAEKFEHSRKILCIDGIDVGDLDYIDIGMEIQSSRTVPVVVKNLVFSQ